MLNNNLFNKYDNITCSNCGNNLLDKNIKDFVKKEGDLGLICEKCGNFISCKDFLTDEMLMSLKNEFVNKICNL